VAGAGGGAVEGVVERAVEGACSQPAVPLHVTTPVMCVGVFV